MALVDGVHRLVKALIVLAWGRLNPHLHHAMRELIAERTWLTVCLPPAYSPGLNPVEGVWAHVERSLADLAVVALPRPRHPRSGGAGPGARPTRPTRRAENQREPGQDEVPASVVHPGQRPAYLTAGALPCPRPGRRSPRRPGRSTPSRPRWAGGFPRWDLASGAISL